MDFIVEGLDRSKCAIIVTTRPDAICAALSATFERGSVLKYGVPTVLLGRPNVGKSSLLNALLGYDRAIVTDVPGTTRDTVEEKLTVGGVLLRLCDTAGIRDTAERVEQLGVDRAEAAAAQASLAILVLDGSAPLTQEDLRAIEVWRQVPRRLVAVNKSDLKSALDCDALCAQLGSAIPVSAKDGQGLSALSGAIAALFPAGTEAEGEVLTNRRQAEAVERALSAIRTAHAALAEGMTPDAVLSDAETALAALGELNGKKIREDLVANIFSRFCVGK